MFVSYSNGRQIFENKKKMLKGAQITLREDLTEGREPSVYRVGNVWTIEGRKNTKHFIKRVILRQSIECLGIL